MAKYVKKPVQVEAILWNGNKISEVTDWIRKALETQITLVGGIMRIGDEIHIHTLEGVMKASAGDYIIKGINGEIYPCKPDIFEKTYSLVKD